MFSLIMSARALTLFLLSCLTAFADTRFGNSTVAMPAAPPESAIAVETAFPTLTFSQPLCLRSAPGDTQRLFVCEKTGDLELIPDVTAGTPTKTIFLDLDSIVSGRAGEAFQTSSEQGLLSVAFHPDYASNGFFFTVYSVRINNSANYQRLSRWKAPGITDTVADPNSEKILIEMLNQSTNHNGGDLHFGPDGYLYMSWGDEGSQHDGHNNSQYLDKDFWSSLIRIDVDVEPADFPGGSGDDDTNLPPNSHAAIKLYNLAGNIDPAGIPLYEIPDDNPWVGATSFNGVTVDPDANVRTEFFAVGFRNPWRFSFDSLTDELWLGDVGQGLWEEVSTVLSGSNHGWAWYEGDANGSKFGDSINGAMSTAATFTFPEWDYAHNGPSTLIGTSVTGGLVFRGNNIGSLYGKYIFADFNSGNIWSLERTTTHGSPIVERIAGQSYIAGFGTDPSNGDLLMADLIGGQIRRLVPGTPDPTFPDTLSKTGIFSSVATLTPNAGVIPYDANLPFWSDYAIKQRWFVIKNTSDLIGYSEDDPWTFPEGMVWVKHFDLELTRGDPATKRRIETRVLVKTATASYGVSYRWNNIASGIQTEATLVADGGEDIPLTIDTGSSTVPQTWSIPSHAQCIICHTPEAGHALSFNTRQLNHSGTLGGGSDNFLTLLNDCGYLDALPSDPAALPRHISPTESTYSLEARVRSYLDVNCAYCHRSAGTAPASWLGNHHLTLDETGLINGPIAAPQDFADRLIVPGNTARSIILSRVAESNGYGRMPPIASNELDQVGIQLLTDWINQEANATVSYNDWRIANFGNDTSPEGAPGENPDNDPSTNEGEWLTHTNPNDGADFLRTTLRHTGTKVEIDIPALSSRRVTVQRSTNLIDWFRWDIPANDSIPLNPASPHTFTATPIGSEEFFRFRIEEN